MLVPSSYKSQEPSLFLLLAYIALLLPTTYSTQHGPRHSPHIGDNSEDARGIPSRQDAQGHFDSQTLVAVRKMTGAEDELFFQHFWKFDFDTPKPPKQPLPKAIGAPGTLINASIPLLMQPPLAVHLDANLRLNNDHWARALLYQPKLWDRAFQCPTGTDA
ncbi:MAG: hypothetical protein Q9180_001797, partial [Flavoplaca navasiana]